MKRHAYRIFLVFSFFIFLSVSGHAATLTVTNTNDSGAGSLRQAILSANTSPGSDAIIFDTAGVFSTTQTIALTSGELLITDAVTISGTGADQLTVSAAPSSRVFNIGPGKVVTISGLTITKGSGIGGIWNDHGNLTVDSCVVSGSTATGIYIQGSGTTYSTVTTIKNTTISGNSPISGGSGGGIVNDGGTGGSPKLVINNSTISGNSSERSGGGIANYSSGGTARVTITNTTISGNSSDFAGAIVNEGSTILTITHSTISDNSGGGISGGLIEVGHTILKRGVNGDNFYSPYTSLGYNIIDDGTTGETNGDQMDTDPLLGPLQDNGGTTFTHALLAGSPAINAGDPDFISPPDYDQRGAGYPRVRGVRIDIGAFEVQSDVAPTPTPAPTATPTPEPTPAPTATPSPTPSPTPRNLVVNSVEDPGEGLCDSAHCTLREAIWAARSGDKITFNLPAPSTITLTNGQLVVDKNLIIEGPGANFLSVSGNSQSRVLNIASGATASISGLTITKGKADAAEGVGGGGIFNDGTLTLTGGAVSANSSSVAGGGIVNSGTLIITSSTLSGNFAATDGGGIYNQAAGILTLTNITVSGNIATFGGGMFNDGGSLTVSNGTFSSNSAFRGAILSGAGVFKNSLFDSSVLESCDTAVEDLGGNLTTGNGCGGVLVPFHVISLTPLTDNGGPTQTHALLSNSLAIDALSDCTDADGNPVLTDQRGVTRPQGARCDVGAFERRPIDFGKFSNTTLETPADTDYSDIVTLRSTTRVEGSPVTGGSVEFFVSNATYGINNASVGTAAVASDGSASLSTQVLLYPSTYSVLAVYKSSQLNITDSQATSTLIVTSEDAMFVPKEGNPPNLKLISGGVFSGNLGRYCFDIVEAPDGSLGNPTLQKLGYWVNLEGYSGQWWFSGVTWTGGSGQPVVSCWNLEVLDMPAGNYTLKLWFENSIFTGTYTSPLRIADPASLKADLLVGLGVDKQDVKQGELLTYTITLRNFGPDPAINALVNDVLSSGTTFVSATANRGRFTAPASGQSGTVSWYPGDIANNSEESAKITVTVIVKGNTTITNTATVSAVSSDPNPANNTASITSNVVLKTSSGSTGGGGGGNGGGPKPR